MTQARVREFVDLMRRQGVPPQELYRVTRSETVQNTRRRGWIRDLQTGIVEYDLQPVASGWIYAYRTEVDGPAGTGFAIGTDCMRWPFEDAPQKRISYSITVDHRYPNFVEAEPNWMRASTNGARRHFVPVVSDDKPSPFDRQFSADSDYQKLVELAAFYTGRSDSPPTIYDY